MKLRFPFDNVNIIKIYGLLTHWPCGYFWNSSSFFVASKIFRHWGLKLIAASPHSGAWMLWMMLLRWKGVPFWCSAILYLIHGITTSLKTCSFLVFGHLQKVQQLHSHRKNLRNSKFFILILLFAYSVSQSPYSIEFVTWCIKSMKIFPINSILIVLKTEFIMMSLLNKTKVTWIRACCIIKWIDST